LAGPRSAGGAWEVDIRVVLDITRLVREGKLSEDEAARLRVLASRDTGTLAINILMSFGAIAVSAGILALNPSFEIGAAVGVTLLLIGLGVIFAGSEQWSLLGTAITVIGTLLLSGSSIGLFEGQIAGTAFTAFLLFFVASLIQSAFLMALVPLALAGALGSSTDYSHAAYMLIIGEPTITIVAFSLLAAIAYFLSQRLGPAYERLAIVFARTSLLLVNFGFWVGSLWGDYPGESWVHDHPCRLVDDEDVVVLEHHREGNRLAEHRAGRRRRHVDVDPFAPRRAIARAFPPTADEHLPVCDQRRGLISGDPEVLRDQEIEARRVVRRVEAPAAAFRHCAPGED